jgi:hypothetical protein
LRKECVSCFFDDEMLFAIDQNIVVDMSEKQQMI